MNFILKFKHWQVFLILLISSLLSNTTLYDEPGLSLVINGLGSLIYFLWYFFVGIELTLLLPPRAALPKPVFIFNAFLLLILYATVIIYFNGHFSSNSWVGFLMGLYFLYAIIQFSSFPWKVLKTIEMGFEASFSQYFKYTILMIFWPIGIWWVQPRINAIAIRNDEIDQEVA